MGVQIVYEVTCNKCGKKEIFYTSTLQPFFYIIHRTGWRILDVKNGRVACPGCNACNELMKLEEK